MNIVVLVAAIEDPKWPVASGRPRIASPFDESALEVALKQRDADPATRITVIVAAAPAEEALLRSLAAHRPDRVLHALAPESLAWDSRGLAQWWSGVVRALPSPPDLVLTGREFGDRDDSTFPACLAEALALTFAPRIVAAAGIAAPALASVTNDRGNKLRHPLMKNVMAARSMRFEAAAAPSAPVARVTQDCLEAKPAPVRAAGARMVSAVAEIAALLRPLRAQA